MPEQLSPEHYKAVLEELPNGVYVVNRERKILFWNRGAEQIAGYRGPEMVGRLCHDHLLMHCDENERQLCGSNCPLTETMFDGRPREADVFLLHKEGHRVPVHVRAVPIRNAEGEIIGAAEAFDERHDVPGLRARASTQAIENHLDHRTGVSDHDSCARYLEACLHDYEKDQMPFSVLMIEVDNLEQVRKIDGGQAAVKILHTVATTLAKSLPEGGIVGHWAADCFLEIVMNCSPATLASLTPTLKHAVSAAEPCWWGDRLAVTASIGSTTVQPGDTLDTLLARAESELSEAGGKRGQQS